MTRPTRLQIEPSALVHNLAQIKHFAPGKKIIAMVKANAYGCGVERVAPVLDGLVDAFGVACTEEALIVRSMGVHTPCILFQGIFSADELSIAVQREFSIVLHQAHQIQWLLNTPLEKPIKVWVKVNTGMNRLGFMDYELPGVLSALQGCSWVDKNIGLMTHLACADDPARIENAEQISKFQDINTKGFSHISIANSAAIISLPHTHGDFIRPGIMLYGVSPFAHKDAMDLGLQPVMRFMSGVTAIHSLPPSAQVGNGGAWSTDKPARIAIGAAGYGDGYPRHIAPNTPVWVRGKEVAIVGKVSMDMLTIDISNHADIEVGDQVELWGAHILVERIAQSAGTIPYELMCQISERVRHA